jgi:hypothetical protein
LGVSRFSAKGARKAKRRPKHTSNCLKKHSTPSPFWPLTTTYPPRAVRFGFCVCGYGGEEVLCYVCGSCACSLHQQLAANIDKQLGQQFYL